VSNLPWYARLATSYGRPAVLIAAIALSAPGEYELARMAGWSPWVAWLMPFTISVYAAAAAALAASRPKGTRASAIIGSGFALLLALAAQVVAHLLASGYMRVDWWLIAIVSAIPPAVVAHVLHLAATPVRATVPAPVEQAPAVAEQAEPTTEPLPEQAETETETPEPGAFLTTREVAERYRVTVSTVRTWANRGRITPALTDPSKGNLYDPETLPSVAAVS
jgi:MFS family permease